VTVLDTALDPRTPGYLAGRGATLERLAQLELALEEARAGGGEKAVTRHHARGKLLPRERVEMLLDRDSPFLELGPVAGWGSKCPVGAGVVTGIGVVEGVECLIIANDPTVDGDAVQPYAAAKIRRGTRVAWANRLPLVTLVESAAGDGTPEAPVPDGDIARDLSRLAADRVPTVCVVFGATTGDVAYLPALSDYTVMVRGQAKLLAVDPQLAAVAGARPDVRSGPAVVTGPADQLADDERDALRLARQCVRRFNWRKRGPLPRTWPPGAPKYAADDLLALAAVDPATGYDPREVLARILDDSDFDEFKPAQGAGLVAGWGELHGYPVGVLAETGVPTPAETQKAVHFIQLANAGDTVLLFLKRDGLKRDGLQRDGLGRDSLGRDSLQRDGLPAPLVHALAKSTVPHLTVLIGGTAGASRTDESRFVFGWPAAGYPASGPDDGVIDPRDTRTILGLCLSAVHSAAVEGAGHVGVSRSGKVDQ
jgi:acetyl-CoA carboxylase carboxyltransferase component